MEQKTYAITGVANGIGRELARDVARAGRAGSDGIDKYRDRLAPKA